MSQVRGNNYTTTTTTGPVGYTTANSTYAPQTVTTSNLPGSYYTTGNQVVHGASGSQVYTVQQPTTTYEYHNVPQYAQTLAGGSHTVVGGGHTVVGGGHTVVGGGHTVVGGGHTVVSGQRTATTDIPVESRIEYIPFQKKYVEYEQVQKIYSVPYEVDVVEYEEVTKTERVAHEKIVTDYYAVQTQVEYIRREIEETVMTQEPVERTYQRVQYIPVETQIVHYPQRDNYVPAVTQKRTEYVGNVQHAVANSAIATYQHGGSRVAGGVTTTNYVSQVPTTTYTTGTTYAANPVTYTTGNAGYTTGGYTTGSYVGGGNGATYTTTTGPTYTTGAYVPTGTTSYQTTTYGNVPATGTYVTGGSGVRGGYVTGGSGVRAGNTTYVSSTSNAKVNSYQTSVPYY